MRYTWTLLLVLPLSVLAGSGRGERNPFSKTATQQTATQQTAAQDTASTGIAAEGTVTEDSGRLAQSPSEKRPLLSVHLPQTNLFTPDSQGTPGTPLIAETTTHESLSLDSPPSIGLSTRPQPETSSAIRIVTPARESATPSPITAVPADAVGLEEDLDSLSEETVLTVPSQVRSQVPSPKTTVGSYFLTQQQPLSEQQATSPQESAEIPASPSGSQAQSSFSDLPPVSPRRSPLFGPSIYGENRIARFTENKILLPPLISPTTNPNDIGSKKLPEDFSGDQLVLRELLREGPDRGEDWSLTAYFWHAPNTYSHPLYFEDVMLERHGHQRFPALQPFVSGGRFFATIPMLPYLMTINPPCDYDYHLGHFRPGTCAPGLMQRPPYVRRAAVVQAAATAGAFIAIP